MGLRRALADPDRPGIRALLALADENDAEFFGDMTAKERAALERVLKSLVARHGLKSILMT
jgi:hypothetical protein